MTFESLKNTKALSLTVGIHLLLLLIFFFVKYQAVTPPALESFDVELTTALGTSDNGLGIDPAEMVMGAPAPPATTAEAGSAADGGNTEASSSSESDINQDETNDEVAATEHAHSTAVLKRAVTNNKTPNPATPVAHNRTNTPTQPSNNSNSRNTAANINNGAPRNATPKYSYTGSNGPGGNGADQNAPGATSRGNGTGNGQQGKPGGDPNGLSYSGGVNGRSIVAGPDNRAEFREGGRVSIKVWVNRDGTITRYSILSAANSTIRAIAAQKVKAIRFNRLPSAPLEQNGVIVINFKAGTGR